ncbi:MAG: DUF3330 domain-containing protein [Thiohalophilus sp.]
MSDTPGEPEAITTPPETVKCAVCRREIPRIDAITDEGADYVRWYCGFDCYQKRERRHPSGSR